MKDETSKQAPEFIEDPLFKKLPENINLDDFYGTCKEISNLIPDIQKSSVVQWGVSYSFIQKYIIAA